ncbi:hypothetical protein GW17_00015848 [Ensete ventricosum]|nr:hypothetical protein GW17_00015848 [Ensete ventricosum]RZR97611.1 hypothetical protein BHM03_00026835 [Ensete ventricosum]
MQFGDGYVLGYWPSFLFSYLEDSATMIEWGGEVVNSEPDGEHTSTAMGSGHFPGEGFGKASYFRNVQIVDGSNNLRPPSDRRKKYRLCTAKVWAMQLSFQLDFGTNLWTTHLPRTKKEKEEKTNKEISSYSLYGKKAFQLTKKHGRKKTEAKTACHVQTQAWWSPYKNPPLLPLLPQPKLHCLLATSAPPPPPFLCARWSRLKSATSNGGSSQAQVVRHGRRDGRFHGADCRRSTGTSPQPHLRGPDIVHRRGPGVGGRPGLRLSALLSDMFTFPAVTPHVQSFLCMVV